LLLDAFEQVRASIVAVHRVPREWVSRYGIVDGVPEPFDENLLRLRRLIEKPSPEAAPSNLAIAGRYVFTPNIFDTLECTPRGVGGEIQLTDAMNLLAAEEPVFALAWNARRFDIGNRLEYAKCFVEFALRRPDTGGELRAHLTRLLAGGPEPLL
jgi:UTP--glucose-1-phosphate uridylyltransferase